MGEVLPTGVVRGTQAFENLVVSRLALGDFLLLLVDGTTSSTLSPSAAISLFLATARTPFQRTPPKPPGGVCFCKRDVTGQVGKLSKVQA